MLTGPPHSPFEVDLGRVSVLFRQFIDETRPQTDHTELPFPPLPNNGKVAILVDGLGSSSAGLYLDKVKDWLEEEGFAVCVFSYRGMGTRTYEPRDTVRSRLPMLVRSLNDYVEHYSGVEKLALVAFSFGGIIVSEWLYERGRSINLLPCFMGSCLIASPIRLQGSRVRYVWQPTKSTRTEEVRGYVDRYFSGYKAVPEHVPAIASMVLLWCENDEILPKELYSFEDIPIDDLPIERRPFEHSLPFRHMDVTQQEELREPLIESVNALCENRMPNFGD